MSENQFSKEVIEELLSFVSGDYNVVECADAITDLEKKTYKAREEDFKVMSDDLLILPRKIIGRRLRSEDT